MSGRDQPLTAEEKAILDQLSRATDPTQQNLEQLVFMIETSPHARDAFAAELFRLRGLAAKCHSNKSRLPKPVNDELERACPKTKSFDHLVALADSTGAPQPELDLTP